MMNIQSASSCRKETTMSKKIVIIPAEGEPYIEDIKGKTVDYDTLSSNVGGWIEHVGLESNLDLWVNEEGKMNGLPVNPIATLLWMKYFGATDIIMGNAVITAGTDAQGDTLGFDENDALSFTAMLGAITNE
jgi:hypothetical protein